MREASVPRLFLASWRVAGCVREGEENTALRVGTLHQRLRNETTNRETTTTCPTAEKGCGCRVCLCWSRNVSLCRVTETETQE